MLIETTAWTRVTGQAGAVTSSSIGASRFGNRMWARCAAMFTSASASRSVGCHVNLGSALAKWTACSPVPLAISSTVPVAGSTRRNTARIGSRLRCVAGARSAAPGKADGSPAPLKPDPQITRELKFLRFSGLPARPTRNADRYWHLEHHSGSSRVDRSGHLLARRLRVQHGSDRMLNACRKQITRYPGNVAW